MSPDNFFKHVMKDFNAACWEVSNHNTSTKWSSNFNEKLGYQYGEIEHTLGFFLEQLLHADQKELFRDNFLNYQLNNVDFEQYIQVLGKTGDYINFRCNTTSRVPMALENSAKIIFFFELNIAPEKTLIKDNFYYQESAEMTETGSWYVDFIQKKSFWDFQTYKILEYSEDYIPSVKDSYNYYTDNSRQRAATLFLNCAMSGTPFNTEIEMITRTGRTFWARAIGKPVYNDAKEIVGIRGVFQNIEENKKKEVRLQKSIAIIESQNAKLFNFAHIVSHNLRSHTSNLALLVQLIESIDDPLEKSKLIDDIKRISGSLNTTIEHLNEVATIQTNHKQSRTKVSFKATLRNVENSICHIIRSGNATIVADFSDLEEFYYIPAYLESIMLNLITNSVKYKDPDRDVMIRLKTYERDGKKYMEVSDNGMGLDLDLYGDKIFGMYKTFHYNEDAVGIGLFITRNQIESLNGVIDVVSEVGKGATFKIQF